VPTRPLLLAVIGVLTAATALAGCATGTAPNVEITPTTPVNNPALATLPDVAVISDLAYSTDAGQAGRLDVCVPPHSVERRNPGPHPAIVEVHGGSWARGDKADLGYRAVCQWLASAGYPTFDLNYRLAPQFPFPAGFDDVRAAVRWLREPAQVARFDIDPDRIGAFGGSAGGNLVSLLGTTGSGGWTGGSRVSAVVELSGPTDLSGVDVTPDFLPTQLSYLRCTSVSDCPAIAPASPIDQVDPSDPPFFVAHSRDESRIPLAQSAAFVAKLRRAGVDTTFVILDGRAHSIAMLNDDLKNRIIAFYHRTLGAQPVGVLN
jgi:acetyl esterase/lipase